MTCRGFTRKQVFHYLGKHLPSFCFLFSLLTLVTNDEWLNLRQGVRSQGICESWGLQRYRLSVELVPLTNATATCGDTSVDSPLFGRGEFKGCKVTHHQSAEDPGDRHCDCVAPYGWMHQQSVERGDTEAAAMWRDLRAAGVVMYVFGSLTMVLVVLSTFWLLPDVASKMRRGRSTHPQDLIAAVLFTAAAVLCLVGGLLWRSLGGSARCADLVDARVLFAAPTCEMGRSGIDAMFVTPPLLAVTSLFQWLFVQDRVRHERWKAARIAQLQANQNQPAPQTVGNAAGNPQDDVDDAETAAGSNV
mmetsp:Transcript_29243/g.84586  ORF Transcript_29243/g.84586 Transcript_29243/m.84586 type:complete len:304 (-) Transcript_29243:483-1394(-)